MALRSQSKVYFFFDDVRFHFSNRRVLKRFIESIFKREGYPLQSLNVIFCSDKGLLRINQDYLSHDYYTDIISSPVSEPGQPIQAELYISIDRVRENAKMLQTRFKTELHRVIFHGVLHLCGYKDKRPVDIKLIRKKEDEYLRSYDRFVSRQTVSG